MTKDGVAGRSIRQEVVRYLTERPGQVLYRADISADTGWDERQVRDTIRRVQDDSVIGREIESVIRGTAWRYVPRNVPPVVITANSDARAATAPNPELPLTSLIREYVIDHAHEVVNLTDLVRYTGRTEYQVQVGVNNMRRITSNHDIVAHLETVTAGRAWRFSPPVGSRYGQPIASSTSPLPVSSPVASPSLPPSDDACRTSNGQVVADVEPVDRDGDGKSRMFEEVGRLRDGRLVLSDENGVMYAASPMQTPFN